MSLCYLFSVVILIPHLFRTNLFFSLEFSQLSFCVIYLSYHLHNLSFLDIESVCGISLAAFATHAVQPSYLWLLLLLCMSQLGILVHSFRKALLLTFPSIVVSFYACPLCFIGSLFLRVVNYLCFVRWLDSVLRRSSTCLHYPPILLL